MHVSTIGLQQLSKRISSLYDIRRPDLLDLFEGDTWLPFLRLRLILPTD